MAIVVFHHGDNEPTEVKIHNGQTILRAAKQGRIALRHKCGGKASCTTCKVKVKSESHPSTPKQIEIKRLGEENIELGFRLSCQTKVIGKIEVEIPEDPFRARVRELLAQQKRGL